MKKLFLQSVIFILFVSGLVMAQTSVIKMNEIYSRGGSTVHPDPDWIEIYNMSNAAVDISGYKIYDNGGQAGTKPKLTIPSGTSLPAKGFYVIVTDISTSINPAGFGLSSGGEQVWLEDAAGTLVDNVTFPSMTETQTYGREFNGSNWKLLNTMTKGLSNSVIVMNEIYSRGTTSDPDWIELYNSSSSAVDISGYKIYDSGGQGGTKPKLGFPAGASIPANGFYVIVTDIPTATNPAGFGLSSNGEEVWLEDNSGNVIDNYTFGLMTETQSVSRKPDGGNWTLANTITKGKTNGLPTSVEINNTMPVEFTLLQNYPNPFNPSTIITYNLTVGNNTTLKVYDILGREVASLINEFQNPGSYKVTFDTRNLNGNILTSGIYFYQLKSGLYSITKKMLLMK
ncbi:MAG: T9SS type A sorting domain-containing protein [Ignavibacteria bacterium]|nr:T9SS type A sorting domain-containing protein [Ignavibacteria bacterium]